MPSIQGFNDDALTELLFSTVDASDKIFQNIDSELLIQASRKLQQASSGAIQKNRFDVNDEIHTKLNTLVPKAPLFPIYEKFKNIGPGFVLEVDGGNFKDSFISNIHQV